MEIEREIRRARIRAMLWVVVMLAVLWAIVSLLVGCAPSANETPNVSDQLVAAEVK